MASSATTPTSYTTPRLKRSFTLWDLIFYGIVLIQPIAPVPLYGVAQKLSDGHFVTIIGIALFAMLITAVSYGRMGALYPTAGSAYTYVGRGLNPHLGFLAGWANVTAQTSSRLPEWREGASRPVSVGGLTDVTLYFTRVMARKNGLADQDYDLLYGGGTPNRFAQLASGAATAAMLTNPVDFAAIEQGFVDLGSVPQYLPHWAQNNIQVDTRWSAQHRAEILAFLRVHIRATRYFYDPANRDDVIAILAKHTRTTRDVAAKTYDLYVRQQVIAPDAALFPDGLQANLDALVAMGEFATPPALAGFIDPSFLAEVAK